MSAKMFLEPPVEALPADDIQDQFYLDPQVLLQAEDAKRQAFLDQTELSIPGFHFNRAVNDATVILAIGHAAHGWRRMQFDNAAYIVHDETGDRLMVVNTDARTGIVMPGMASPGRSRNATETAYEDAQLSMLPLYEQPPELENTPKPYRLLVLGLFAAVENEKVVSRWVLLQNPKHEKGAFVAGERQVVMTDGGHGEYPAGTEIVREG